jgi:hypothetical protein
MESDVSQVFLRTSDFAVEATFTFGSIVRPNISVVFDENYSAADTYGVEVANSGPAAICKTSDIENDDDEIPGENEDAATLLIGDVTYNVTKAARAGDTCLLIFSKD